VQAQIPKDKGVIMGCQKGLRSLAAAEQLSRAGYARVAWINGGFDTARPGDLKTSNGRDIRWVVISRGVCVEQDEGAVLRMSGRRGGERGGGQAGII
jgi:hypothetical protein